MERSPSPPKVIDLSQSLFRGSGAIYQTDRLTVGRTRGPMIIAGKDQVIEKVVYKTDDSAQATIDDLGRRLKDACMRLVLISIENKKLTKQMIFMQQSKTEVFESQQSYENEQLKNEVGRLKQLIVDKEKEIQFVKEAEIRKSAIQSGDLIMRLKLTSEENTRLQNANVLRITQINQINSEVSKAKQEASALATQMTHSTNSEQLKIIQAEKESKNKALENQISKLTAELNSEKGYKDELSMELSSLRQKLADSTAATMTQQSNKSTIDHLKSLLAEKDITNNSLHNQVSKLSNDLKALNTSHHSEISSLHHQLAEATSANDDLFRINQHLEQKIESSQQNSINHQDLGILQSRNDELHSRLEDLQARNLDIRDELARMTVAYSQSESALRGQIQAEIRENEIKVKDAYDLIDTLRTANEDLRSRKAEVGLGYSRDPRSYRRNRSLAKSAPS